MRRLAVLGIDRNDNAGREKLLLSNFEFFGGPCVLFLFMDASLTEWSNFDMGLFAQSLILALHAFGLGSCLQASVTDYAREIKQFLNIADSKKLIVGISIGYPELDHRYNDYRAIKQEPAEFTKWYA
jgi:nitroreductase